MERSSDPHHSTADLLSWPQIHHSSAANPSNQPSDDIGDVLGGGGRTTNKEAKSLNKNVSYRKNCCGHKLKEMTGSDIFSDNGNVTNGDPTHTSRIHYHHDQDSQISFSGEENNNAAATPKKPTTTSSPEAAKLKELGRSVQTQADSKSKKKQLSNSKTKAITGRDIFASPPPPPATKQQVKGNNNMEESAKASNGQSCNSEEHVVKSSRKIHNNPRFQQLTSNGIFKSDKIPPGYSEKMHSSAKSREMRVFTQPKKNLLPLLLFLFCISVIILLILLSETTHSVPQRDATLQRIHNNALPPFTFLIKVLTFNRPHSLSRCLLSLSAADYGVAGDTQRIHLHVYVDHFTPSRDSKSVGDRLSNAKEILDFVDKFEWRFGEKLVHYRTGNAGLQGQWLEAWWPSSDHEFAFVVEDDLEVSPLYYGFLESVIRSYYYDRSNYDPSVYGASLQRPRFVPGKHGNKLHLDPKTNVFLYQLVGTWGQLLFPKPWKEFRLWYDEHKSKDKKPFLDGMVTNGWYKRLGERIWTPWFIKFIHSRGYFNIYTNFQNERALSVSHRDAGVNYGKTAGPDSQLLNKSTITSDFLKLQPLSNLKWYDYCFSEVVPGRVVRSLNELGTILPSVQRDKTVVLVSLFGADKMFIRNLLCHFEKIDTRNHVFIGPSSELFYDLSRRGHPVIDADMFLDKLVKSKTSYSNSVKEALGNAYVVKKCLELGYSTWVFSSNALLVDKSPLLDRVRSEYDFYIGESSGILIVQSSAVAQKLWSNELLNSIVSSATKNLDFIQLVKELVERKGKMIKTVETMSIAENNNANSVNQSLGDGKPVVYWSPEVDSNIIRTKLEELKLWLIDDDLSCKAVICHSSLR